MEQLSVRLLLTAGILLLIAGVFFSILQVWLYTGLLWAGAFGCLMTAHYPIVVKIVVKTK